MIHCPDNFKRRAQILYCNSLSGFQFEGGVEKGYFAICWCSSDLSQEQIESIKNSSNATTLGELEINIFFDDSFF